MRPTKGRNDAKERRNMGSGLTLPPCRPSRPPPLAGPTPSPTHRQHAWPASGTCNRFARRAKTGFSPLWIRAAGVTGSRNLGHSRQPPPSLFGLVDLCPARERVSGGVVEVSDLIGAELVLYLKAVLDMSKNGLVLGQVEAFGLLSVRNSRI